MFDHRQRASTPPTLQEAWAAVLDNPKLPLRIAWDEATGSEDDVQDARIAAAHAFVNWDLTRSRDILGLTRWAFRQTRSNLGRPVSVSRSIEDAFRQWEREADGLRVRGLPVPPQPPPELQLPRDPVALASLRCRSGAESAHDPQQRLDAEVGHSLWLETLRTTEPVESEALLNAALRRAWDRLEVDDQCLLRERFTEGLTLEDSGALRGLSRERIRQRIGGALRKMRDLM
jgi:RNA polymerase sigma factor (sigma-70 family)